MGAGDTMKSMFHDDFEEIKIELMDKNKKKIYAQVSIYTNEFAVDETVNISKSFSPASIKYIVTGKIHLTVNKSSKYRVSFHSTPPPSPFQLDLISVFSPLFLFPLPSPPSPFLPSFLYFL